MSVFKAVFYRFYSKQHENFDSLQDAIEFLEHGADYNELSPIAVIWDGKISWVNTFYDISIIEKECKEFLS